MLKKYGSGFLLLVCTLAPAQSTAPANHGMAVRAGRFERVQVPADAEVVDLTPATVLLRLSDAHTHVFGNRPDFDTQILRDSYQYRTLTALANAQKDLKDLMVGFTTLRDLKTPGAMYSDVDLRNAIDVASSRGLACR